MRKLGYYCLGLIEPYFFMLTFMLTRVRLILSFLTMR